jgi:hypothetical protein
LNYEIIAQRKYRTSYAEERERRNEERECY